MASMIKPAIITVGDEIILGEKVNGNEHWLLQTFWQRGLAVKVSLALPDDVVEIAHWIRILKREQYFPIFISGGLGGTHDDYTRDAVAAGLGVELVLHEECDRILAAGYGDQYTAQRRRMAHLPRGCDLLSNLQGAPGFSLQGVWAFPGFPRMLMPMVNRVLDALDLGQIDKPWWVLEAIFPVSEGDIAIAVENFALSHPEAIVGIYANADKAIQETTVRLRKAQADPALEQEFSEFCAKLYLSKG